MSGSLPKAYRVGRQDFYGRDFLVTPDVLIPRPETEMAVDMVLNWVGAVFLPGVKPAAARLPHEMRILDVGTGSGCIAITLKMMLPEADVSACDISEKALAVAKRNAKNMGAKVNFCRSNLLENMPNVGDFDVVVANLPYVDEKWEWLDHEMLAVEPREALFAKDEGLDLIKRLVCELANVSAQETSEKTRAKPQYLILEADPCQHEKIIQYASGFGLKHIETRGFILGFLKG